MGSHATWYARGLGDGAGLALSLPARWTVTAIREAGASTDDYVAYVRARAEAYLRTRGVIERRQREAQQRREFAAFLAAQHGQHLRWLHFRPLRLGPVRLVSSA